jgi:hypothetical protein
MCSREDRQEKKKMSTLADQIALASEENSAQIARARAKGRTLLIDDTEMIAAYEAFLASGQDYSDLPQKGVWFPDTLRTLANPSGNTNLDTDSRARFARDCFEITTCPEWRPRGW